MMPKKHTSLHYVILQVLSSSLQFHSGSGQRSNTKKNVREHNGGTSVENYNRFGVFSPFAIITTKLWTRPYELQCSQIPVFVRKLVAFVQATIAEACGFSAKGLATLLHARVLRQPVTGSQYYARQQPVNVVIK